MAKFEKYTGLIQKDFPDFFISSIQKIGEGDNSKAFLVNKNYIFRFPKRKIVKCQIQREICVLPYIKSAIHLSIPEFEFISPHLNFVGYKKINGDILSNTTFLSLSKNQQRLVQKELGNFLTQIHSFYKKDLKDCQLETMDLSEEYLENFGDAQQLIYPDISKNKQRIITHLFTEYLNNSENFSYTPVLVHNDFSKDHILCGIANEHAPERIIRAGITGIIDFGDIAFGDPDYDFMYLLDEFGEDFLNPVMKYYKRREGNISLEKIRFFTLGNKIQSILGCKKENDDEGIEWGLRNLDLWFGRYRSKR